MINETTIAKLATLVKEYNMNLDGWDLVLADKKATKKLKAVHMHDFEIAKTRLETFVAAIEAMTGKAVTLERKDEFNRVTSVKVDGEDLTAACGTAEVAAKIEKHMAEGASLTRSGSHIIYTSASGKVLHIQAFKNDREIFIPADFTICDDEGNTIREHILSFQVVDIIRHGV